MHIGEGGLEPPTFRSRSGCATRLRHSPSGERWRVRESNPPRPGEGRVSYR
jgi:hypothetical protein